MPLTKKGEEVKANMEREYGQKKGEQVFYATENKGKERSLVGDNQLETMLPESVSAADVAANAAARYHHK